MKSQALRLIFSTFLLAVITTEELKLEVSNNPLPQGIHPSHAQGAEICQNWGSLTAPTSSKFHSRGLGRSSFVLGLGPLFLLFVPLLNLKGGLQSGETL